MRFQGKVAVVTGGASGIGQACAAALADEGADVAVLDLKESSACRISLRCDVSSAADTREAFSRVAETLGPVHVLVNAAGIIARRDVAGEEEESWDRCMAVNLKGIYLCSQQALLTMPSGGSIIHLSSVTGIVGVRGRAAYSASKGAIVALTRNMALDYASRNIRVNCVCPGFVRTPLLHALLQDPERTARLTAMHPLGRLGDPRDIANAIVFLASPEAAWITGTALVVDGGFSAGQSSPI